jgi:hypothetical protein
MSAVLTTDQSPSPLALRVGHALLAPFVVGAALAWFVDERVRDFTTQALSVYAAMVVSFLGGIHWGVGFGQGHASPALFAWGVVPGALAWTAAIMPPGAGLALNAVTLVVCYLVDRKLYPPLGLAPWLTWRFRLSSVAALCCFLAAAAA